MLRVTTRTIWRWAAAGRIERVQIGGVSRYPAAAVETLIADSRNQRVSSPAAGPGSTQTTEGTVEGEDSA